MSIRSPVASSFSAILGGAELRANDLKHKFKSSLGVAVESVRASKAGGDPFRGFWGVGGLHTIPKLSCWEFPALVGVLRSSKRFSPNGYAAREHIAEEEGFVAEGDDSVGRRVDFQFEST
jgi:hypothetical protein